MLFHQRHICKYYVQILWGGAFFSLSLILLFIPLSVSVSCSLLFVPHFGELSKVKNVFFFHIGNVGKHCTDFYASAYEKDVANGSSLKMWLWTRKRERKQQRERERDGERKSQNAFNPMRYVHFICCCRCYYYYCWLLCSVCVHLNCEFTLAIVGWLVFWYKILFLTSLWLTHLLFVRTFLNNDANSIKNPPPPPSSISLSHSVAYTMTHASLGRALKPSIHRLSL